MRVLLVELHKIAYEMAVVVVPFREGAVLQGEHRGGGEGDYKLVTPSPGHTRCEGAWFPRA